LGINNGYLAPSVNPKFPYLPLLVEMLLHRQKVQYDKQDQQGKAALIERNTYTTQKLEIVARSQGRP
jgi:hypothetical protein